VADDNRRFAAGREMLHRAQHLDTAHIGQPEIKKDGIDSATLQE
jgi:hypothetical protein